MFKIDLIKERYCHNCHSIKQVSAFDKPSYLFRVSCLCRDCYQLKCKLRKVKV